MVSRGFCPQCGSPFAFSRLYGMSDIVARGQPWGQKADGDDPSRCTVLTMDIFVVQ